MHAPSRPAAACDDDVGSVLKRAGKTRCAICQRSMAGAHGWARTRVHVCDRGQPRHMHPHLVDATALTRTARRHTGKNALGLGMRIYRYICPPGSNSKAARLTSRTCHHRLHPAHRAAHPAATHIIGTSVHSTAPAAVCGARPGGSKTNKQEAHRKRLAQSPAWTRRPWTGRTGPVSRPSQAQRPGTWRCPSWCTPARRQLQGDRVGG